MRREAVIQFSFVFSLSELARMEYDRVAYRIATTGRQVSIPRTNEPSTLVHSRTSFLKDLHEIGIRNGEYQGPR
jgi:hypothetical protein